MAGSYMNVLVDDPALDKQRSGTGSTARVRVGHWIVYTRESGCHGAIANKRTLAVNSLSRVHVPSQQF